MTGEADGNSRQKAATLIFGVLLVTIGSSFPILQHFPYLLPTEPGRYTGK